MHQDIATLLENMRNLMKSEPHAQVKMPVVLLIEFKGATDRSINSYTLPVNAIIEFLLINHLLIQIYSFEESS